VKAENTGVPLLTQ